MRITTCAPEETYYCVCGRASLSCSTSYTSELRQFMERSYNENGILVRMSRWKVTTIARSGPGKPRSDCRGGSRQSEGSTGSFYFRDRSIAAPLKPASNGRCCVVVAPDAGNRSAG